MMVIQKCQINAIFNYKYLRMQEMKILIKKKTKEIAAITQL